MKFSLEQNNRLLDKNMGAKKSTKKRDELNPVYGETFTWEIDTLDNMELTCKVMDDDILGDDKIGKCKIKLENMGLSATPTPISEKVNNRLIHKDSYIFLTIKYEE